jgi:hypothetical protein
MPDVARLVSSRNAGGSDREYPNGSDSVVSCDSDSEQWRAAVDFNERHRHDGESESDSDSSRGGQRSHRPTANGSDSIDGISLPDAASNHRCGGCDAASVTTASKRRDSSVSASRTLAVSSSNARRCDSWPRRMV